MHTREVLHLMKWISLTLTFFLTACGTFKPDPSIAQTQSQLVALNGTEQRSDLVAQYSREIIAWHPEAGFAVLSTANEAPTVQSGALRAWSGGFRVWSGGIRAWGGGEAGGPVLPANAEIWNKVALAAAHTQLAPKLGDMVTIAVIDTGLDLNHPAFAGRLTPKSTWYDFVNDDSLPQEVVGEAYGHGTAVASIALQVAPKARVLPLRVLGTDGSGLPSDVVRAVDHALNLGADVIQLSLGTSEPDEALEQMVAYATTQGVYVVASAGNSDSKLTYPAANAMQATPAGDMTVGVGSVGINDIKSSFSNFVPDNDPTAEDGLEMVAFGENVFAASPGNKMASWDGTSMAAPMVAGTLALALGEGAERFHPRQLGIEVVDEGLEIDASGSSQGQTYELEQRLEVGLFLCDALDKDAAACRAAYAAAEDNDEGEEDEEEESDD